MNIVRCHMCGREQPDYALIDLLSSYKTKDISKLCDKCAKEADNHLAKLRAVNHDWYSRVLKIWLRNNRRKFTRGSK